MKKRALCMVIAISMLFPAVPAYAEQEPDAAPGFYRYGSDYGREYLLNNKPEEYVDCYDALLKQCIAFEGSYTDIIGEEVAYSNSETATVYYLPNPSNKYYKLTIEELEDVYYTLTNDHPEFYWLNGFDYSYHSEEGPYGINLMITEEYASGSARQRLDNEIQVNFEKYLSTAQRYMVHGEYMTAKKLHDDISGDVKYCNVYVYVYAYKQENGEDIYTYVYENADGSYVYENDDGEYIPVDIEDEGVIRILEPSSAASAHSIVSALDADENTMPVCEGYAKTYKLILNALGIDNVYVTGWGNGDNGRQEHAWNMVKLDDGNYYFIDLTWDDQDGGIVYDYFARGKTGFLDHEENNPDGDGFDFLYALPDAADDDFEVMPFVNKNLISNMEVTHSGTCGDDLNWDIYENGLLYISGTGDMSGIEFDYDKQISSAPWYPYEAEIKYVVVDEGVRSISSFAFWKCYGITHVYISDGVEKIGAFVLGNDRSGAVKALRIPASLTSFENDAFKYCESITDIYYGGTEEQWADIDKSGAAIPDTVTVHYNYAEPQPDTDHAYTISDTKIENGMVEVKLTKNIASADAMVILAAYDNEALSFILQQTAEDGMNTFTDSRIDSTKTYKIFVWNSLGQMQPLAIAN